MARIKIDDLPVLEELSPGETKGIFGGAVASLAGSPNSLAETRDLYDLSVAAAKPGKSAGMANVDLQQSMQQHHFQTLSAIMKTHHDTAKSIISNMKA